MTRIETFREHFFLHFEWLALFSILVAAALLNPYSTGVDLCFFNFVGIEFCPGEGIGRSMAHVFRGNLTESFEMHPAGIPGVLIISTRVGSLLKERLTTKNSEDGNESI